MRRCEMAEPRTGETRPRRRVNTFGIVLALLFLMVASAGFAGDAVWLFSAATRWIVAGVIAFVGLILLLTALPGRRRS